MKNRSAKDIAFDRERTKYRSIIEQQNRKIRQLETEIKESNKMIAFAREKIERLNNEIIEIVNLSNMPAEQLRQFLEDEREKAERERKTVAFIDTFSKLGGRYF